MEQLDEETILAELDPRARALFVELRGYECECALLRFLNQHAHVLMTLDDIAYHLGKPRDVVEHALEVMIEKGLVREVVVQDLTFFGITNEHELRQVIAALASWQDRWHDRLAEIERLLIGQAKAN